MVTKLPRLFDIFSPSTCRNPLCIQTLAMRFAAEGAAGLGDLVLVVGEDEVDAAAVDVERVAAPDRRTASPPPNGSNSFAIDIAEHSMCQPGRPGVAMPAGLGQPGSFGFDGFHSTKSIGSRL